MLHGKINKHSKYCFASKLAIKLLPLPHKAMNYHRASQHKVSGATKYSKLRNSLLIMKYLRTMFA